MIVPVLLSDGSGTKFGKSHRGQRPSIVTLIYSDDTERTWQCGEIVCRNGDKVFGKTVINPSETVAVELDGRVMFNIRSESKIHRRLISFSLGGVSSWSDHCVLEDEYG